MLTFELCLFIRGRMARPLLLCLLLRAGSPPVAGTQAGGFILITRTHSYTHIMAHRNPEGAILDGFVKVRESVETVYTKNFNGFYFKHLQRKSHQIVTTNIKSLIVTNPRLYCQFICMAYFLVRTSTDTILVAKMLNSITTHVNLQEASYT